MQRYEFTISAAYSQILVGIFGDDSDDPSDIAEEDLERRIKDCSNCLVIYTARSRRVPVVVEFHEGEPHTDFTLWSHVAEASLSLDDQNLALMGLWDSTPKVCHFETPPGSYRLRAHYGGLESVTDPDGEGEDHYLLVLWPASPEGVTILKQYVRPA